MSDKQINVTITKAVNNLGGGGFVNLTEYQKTADADGKYQLKGDYVQSGAITAIAARVEANAATISTNTQLVQQATATASANTTLIQTMQADLAGKASKTYVDGRFEQIVGAAPATLDTLQEIAAAIQSDQTATGNILTTLGRKADINYVDGKFQPIGDYAYRSEIAGFITTSTANQTFAPKSHTHAAADISGLVDYSKQFQITGNLGLSDSLNNTLLIGKATATIAVPTGLAACFVGEVYASVGDITVSGASGVSFEANGGKFIIKQGKSAVLIQIAGSNVFILKGELS